MQLIVPFRTVVSCDYNMEIGNEGSANNEDVKGNDHSKSPFISPEENTFKSLSEQLVESNVKELQARLFPPSPRPSTSYFANFVIKSRQEYEEEVEIRETPSRDLFVLHREGLFMCQSARWPTECQVLDDRILHIPYTPPTPEPYYKLTGKEVQPKPVGEECGLIVFQYIPISAVNYFSRSSVGGSKYLLSTNLCPEEDTLRFESRFESGNLARAIRITPSYYELYLRSDLYTNRHMQWFYFRVTNMKKNFMYRFAIVNLTKDESLYNEGMKPLMYSTKDSQLHSIGWRRCGDNISYYCNENVTPEDPDQMMTYTLTFTMEFPHEEDEVYLAHSYPYTYTDLQDYLMQICNHPLKSGFSTLRLLCKTLAGNNVYYMTITSPPVPGEIKKKKAVVITARVHPGETPASWMMKGFMDFLTSDSAAAKELRDKFIFKLVPMLNPDGVIVGNTRCSLSAKDLNRQYRTVMRDAYPSIWYTKLMVRRLLEECGVAMYCDLHAHSRKHNIFVYGCENKRGGEKRLQEQVFPLMLHKNAADRFSFENCKFRITKAKEGTGRIVMWMIGIANSYTMEASFAGSTLGTRAETHFSTQDLEQMGKSFCQTLLDFCDEDPRKERLRLKIINRLLQGGSNADEPLNIILSDYSSDEGDTSSSSSNEVGRGDRDDEEEIIVPIVPPPTPVQQKKTKSRNTVSKPKPPANKSPCVPRKPLPICKATLGLSLSEKDVRYSSDSESSDTNYRDHEKKTGRRRRRRKRKSERKKQVFTKDYSDSEIQVRRTTRSVSAFDFTLVEKIPPEPVQRRSKTPQPKRKARRTDSEIATEIQTTLGKLCENTPYHEKDFLSFKKMIDKRHSVTQQLAEVQAKLFTLKTKLWFGATTEEPNADAPLSWGPSRMESPPRSKNTKTTKKSQKKKNAKQEKQEKVEKKHKEGRAKTESKDKSSKRQHNGYKTVTLMFPQKNEINLVRKQNTISWIHESETFKLRKTKSLPDSTVQILHKPTMKALMLSCDEERKPEPKKKKKKKSKLAQKVKAVVNVKTFLKKD